jgi:HD-GYP domain-containing protein (c-di-GMP phosphodiesterase class II)
MMERITFLNRIGEEILREKDIDHLLEIAVDRITDILEAERATFYFFNEDTQELWSYVATDLEIKEVRVPSGKGIAGKAALEKRMLNVRDAYKCKFFNKEIDKKTGYRTKTVLCAPLLDRNDKLVGALQILNKKRGYFTENDEKILRSLSLYITISLENIRLLQEEETLFRSTLYALAQAIDTKDPVTAGHSYRVAYFSVKIAVELEYAEEKLKIVEYAAYLHDVGKIGIPDRVLLKRKKLTPQEYALMKKHPLHTLQILKNIIFSRESKKIPFIASHHHELLDGSGYPFGLKYGQIDNYSRIITVADIYDALVSFDRPYKKSLSVKEALKILREEVRKKHLDRRIVNIFIEKQLYKFERRRYKRTGLHTSISYQIIPQRRIFKEKIKDNKKFSPYDLGIAVSEKRESVDISEGGALFLTKQYLPVGTYLDLEIELLSIKIRCIGKAVWTEKLIGTPYYRVGVGFINIAHRDQKILSQQISQLSAQKSQS